MPLNKKAHKRPRFYADENVFPESINFLRSKKINVLHAVKDLNFGGKDDTFHWESANKYQRVLLTLDRDFLNNRLFPLRQTWGTIIIVVPPPVTDSKINIVLEKMLPILKLQNKEYYHCKKIIANLDTMTIQTLNRSGRINSEIINL
jgi:predicted nuclease of predicted toxin-antitoxin system